MDKFLIENGILKAYFGQEKVVAVPSGKKPLPLPIGATEDVRKLFARMNCKVYRQSI